MLLLAALACSSGEDSGAHDSEVAEDSEPLTEGDCWNELDDDQDGLADCEDPDCEVPCGWPLELQHNYSLDLVGAVVDCSFGGQPTQVTVGDCKLSMTSQLSPSAENTCSDCDRSYQGALTWHDDTCQEAIPGARPGEGRYGFAFGEGTWRLYQPDLQGVWKQGPELLVDDHGGYSAAWTAPLSVELEGCDDGPHAVGTTTTRLIFIEPPPGA